MNDYRPSDNVIRRQPVREKAPVELQRICVPELQDFKGRLSDFKHLVNRMADLYPPDTELHLDAGHNNVSVVLSVDKRLLPKGV